MDSILNALLPSCNELYQGVQDYWTLKGVIAGDGTKKLAFDVLRDHHRERKHTEERASWG